MSKLWDPSSSKEELSSFSLLTQQVGQETKPDDKSPYTKQNGELTPSDIEIHNKISIIAMFLYYAFLHRFDVFTKMPNIKKTTIFVCRY